MQVLVIGSGNVASKVNMALQEHGHGVEAQVATFSPNQLDMFDCQGIVVVGPEGTAGPESLTKAAERGRHLFLVVGSGSDGLAGWADSVGTATFPYPLSKKDTQDLLQAVRQAESGVSDAGDVYRRAKVGADFAARLQSGMATRKIAITSPKGGVGKTTLSVNLAVAFALSGITTYLVDADGNAGAVYYHMRFRESKGSIISLLRNARSARRQNGRGSAMEDIVGAAGMLEKFKTVDDLPTLKVLPGVGTDDLGDQVFQNEQQVTAVIKQLFEVGTATGGVVIMDVGINPAHPMHRAALRAAEGVAIVVKPEVPDLAETRRWIQRMVRAIERDTGSRSAAIEFIKTHARICYNQVVDGNFRDAQRMLKRSLAHDDLDDIEITPNGIIPFVDPRLASAAVSSNHREDILIWRYQDERTEELQPFAEALIDFAANFVPAVREGADRSGLLATDQNGDKKRLFGLF